MSQNISLDKSKATIERCDHDEEQTYFLAPKIILKNLDLSIEARFFLVIISSLPSDYKIRPSEISKVFGYENHILDSVIEELIKQNYAQRINGKISLTCIS